MTVKFLDELWEQVNTEDEFWFMVGQKIKEAPKNLHKMQSEHFKNLDENQQIVLHIDRNYAPFALHEPITDASIEHLDELMEKIIYQLRTGENNNEEIGAKAVSIVVDYIKERME